MDIELSQTHKGALILVAGSILFLYSIGIWQKGLTILIIISSLLMLVYGFHLLEGRKTIQKLVKKTKEYQAKKVAKNKEEKDNEV